MAADLVVEIDPVVEGHESHVLANRGGVVIRKLSELVQLVNDRRFRYLGRFYGDQLLALIQLHSLDVLHLEARRLTTPNLPWHYMDRQTGALKFEARGGIECYQRHLEKVVHVVDVSEEVE